MTISLLQCSGLLLHTCFHDHSTLLCCLSCLHVTAPRISNTVQNSLSVNSRSAESFVSFKRRLKRFSAITALRFVSYATLSRYINLVAAVIVVLEVVVFTNRKSIRACLLYQNRWPWMTLNRIMAVILRHLAEISRLGPTANTSKRLNVDAYLLRQKGSTKNLLFGFVWIMTANEP